VRPAGRIGRAALALVVATAPAAASDEVSYERDVLPILTAQCVMCHLPGAALGELSLYPDARAALVGVASAQSSLKLVEPGAPERSYLYLKMTGTQSKAGGSGEPMPPTGLLDAGTIELIRRWIAQGAAGN
jgi:mono/diheme cytochrome c family protein